MVKVELRACPRCRGDVHDSQDIYGAYKKCLQCGYMLNVQSTPHEVLRDLEAASQARKRPKAA